jgi:peptidylprolyl isomerase
MKDSGVFSEQRRYMLWFAYLQPYPCCAIQNLPSCPIYQEKSAMKFVLIVLALITLWFVAQQFMSSGKAKDNIQLGESFLDGNSEADGVQSTASGLQYKVLETGTGSIYPTATDRVKVHYHGTLIDGTVFDSSVDRGEPISFGLNQVIPGWTEGLQLMVEGEKTRLFIPSKLAYGNRAAGKIKPGSTLLFDVELIGINVD